MVDADALLIELNGEVVCDFEGDQVHLGSLDIRVIRHLCGVVMTAASSAIHHCWLALGPCRMRSLSASFPWAIHSSTGERRVKTHRVESGFIAG